MWSVEQGMRLWFRPGATSMRLGIRGLSNMVWGWQGHSPASGDIYLFFSRNRRQVKVLRWDGDGFLLYQKRLAKGCFRMPRKTASSGVLSMDWDEFYFIMRGLTPVEVREERRFKMGIK